MGGIASPSEGLNILSEAFQYIWDGEQLITSDGECEADELYRFIKKHKGQIYHNNISSNNESKKLADQKLNELLTQLSPGSGSPIRKMAGLLFRKCLKGIEIDEMINPDSLHEERNNLDAAITTLVLIQNAIDADLMPSEKSLGYGQLIHTTENTNEEREVLVWNSKESAKALYDKVMNKVVKPGGSARPLTIIGKGNGHCNNPQDGRIKSGRYDDFGNPAPNVNGDREICEASDRVVFWKNQGTIDEVLSSNKVNQNLLNDLKNLVNLDKQS